MNSDSRRRLLIALIGAVAIGLAAVAIVFRNEIATFVRFGLTATPSPVVTDQSSSTNPPILIEERLQAAAKRDTTALRLLTAVTQGSLSREQYLLYRLWAEFTPEKVPAEYVGTESEDPTYGGVDDIQMIIDEAFFSNVSSEVRTQIDAVLSEQATQTRDQATGSSMRTAAPLPARPTDLTLYEPLDASGSFLVHFSDETLRPKVQALVNNLKLEVLPRAKQYGFSATESDAGCKYKDKDNRIDVYLVDMLAGSGGSKPLQFGYNMPCEQKELNPGFYLLLDPLADLDTTTESNIVMTRTLLSYSFIRSLRRLDQVQAWVVEATTRYLGFKFFEPQVSTQGGSAMTLIFNSFIEALQFVPNRSLDLAIKDEFETRGLATSRLAFFMMLDATRGAAQVSSDIQALWTAGGTTPALQQILGGDQGFSDALLTFARYNGFAGYASPVGYPEGADYPAMKMEGTWGNHGAFPVEDTVFGGHNLGNRGISFPRENFIKDDGSLEKKITVAFWPDEVSTSQLARGQVFIITGEAPNLVVSAQELPLANNDPQNPLKREIELDVPTDIFDLRLIVSNTDLVDTTGFAFGYSAEFEPECDPGQNFAGGDGRSDGTCGPGGGNPPPGYGPVYKDGACDNAGVCQTNHGYQNPHYYCTQTQNDHTQYHRYLPNYTFENCSDPSWEPYPQFFGFDDGSDVGTGTPGLCGELPRVTTPDALTAPVCFTFTPYVVSTQQTNGHLTPLAQPYQVLYGDFSTYDEGITDATSGKAYITGMPHNENPNLPATYFIRIEVPQDMRLVPSAGQSTVIDNGRAWAQQQFLYYESGQATPTAYPQFLFEPVI